MEKKKQKQQDCWAECINRVNPLYFYLVCGDVALCGGWQEKNISLSLSFSLSSAFFFYLSIDLLKKKKNKKMKILRCANTCIRPSEVHHASCHDLSFGSHHNRCAEIVSFCLQFSSSNNLLETNQKDSAG